MQRSLKFLSDLQGRLQDDGIELLDYRQDALNVVEKIRRELDDMHGAALPAD